MEKDINRKTIINSIKSIGKKTEKEDLNNDNQIMLNKIKENLNELRNQFMIIQESLFYMNSLILNKLFGDENDNNRVPEGLKMKGNIKPNINLEEFLNSSYLYIGESVKSNINLSNYVNKIKILYLVDYF